MKQHPIPQNILDIEFKLFTKFTVREFVYMAVGVGFGGIFLYFFTKQQVPGIIAFPIFIASSGIGLFLGLVPINDQKADVFLKNYFIAISNPTQRVWKNKDVDEKFSKKELDQQISETKGGMDRTSGPTKTAKVIGTSTDESISKQFIEEATLAEIDKEEAEKLAKIDADLKRQEGTLVEKKVQIPPEQSAPKPPEENPSVTPSPTPQLPQKITITSDNASIYKSDRDMNTTGFMVQIVDQNGTGVENAIATLKDAQGRVLFAQKSDASGNILASKIVQGGTFNLDVKRDGFTFPQFQIVSDIAPIKSVKVTAV